MGNNLPDHVSISYSDAPWNQSYPDPSDTVVSCTECGWSGTVEDAEYTDDVYCPECGARAGRKIGD